MQCNMTAFAAELRITHNMQCNMTAFTAELRNGKGSHQHDTMCDVRPLRNMTASAAELRIAHTCSAT